MKSFSIAALAGAASAAWAPPAYGGESSAPVASTSSAPPAEGYSQPPAGYDTTSASVSKPTGYAPSSYGSASSSMATYACNPAHSYPNGATCVSTYGTLSLVTPSASVPGAYGSSSAPAYTPKPTGGYGGSWGSSNGTAGGYGGHGGDSYVTQVVTSFETYCPYATTKTYGGKTYTVSSATTLTVTDCDGGCQITVPAASYKPSITTEVFTSTVTTCPYATTLTYGPSTYTISSSTVLTVTDCPGGCTATHEVPATWVVPTLSTYVPKPSVPSTVTIGTETYPVTEATTIVVTAPTSYATYTSVFSQPEKPTSVVIESTTYPVSAPTTITWSQPTQGGYTVTGPLSSYYTPAASSPAGPVPNYPAPSGTGYAPAGNGSTPYSPVPQQTGNAAPRVLAGGAAFGALVGALFL